MKKKYKYIIAWATSVLLLWALSIFWFQFFSEPEEVSLEEQANRQLDKYNFEQLKEVKKILSEYSENEYRFGSLKTLNEKYNVNIQPQKNCYLLVDRNWDYEKNKWIQWFTFGFKLYSEKYKEKYKEDYYIYSKYDLPVARFCTGVCYDAVLETFKKIIENPCQDDAFEYYPAKFKT